MIERVLVATDFSEGAKDALGRAEEIARGTHAELIVLHVCNDVQFVPPDGFGYIPLQFPPEQARQIDELVSEQVGALREKGFSARGLRASGQPHLEICSAAEQQHADLIVMGTHGRRGLARLALGSVAERVVRTSKIPVLVVPPLVAEER